MAQSTLPTLGASSDSLYTDKPVDTTSLTPPAFQPQTASTAAFDPATQTVQGQIKSIIDANSPLMQQAETRSMQQMNGRGLINSSMAVGAGQAALYDTAMPIAASDAQAYNQNQQFNVGQENQFKNASNAQGFDLAKMRETQGFDLAKMRETQGFDLAKMRETQGFDMAEMAETQRNQTAQLQQKFGYDTELTKMQTASAKETADIQAKFRNLTQASSSLTSLANNASDQIHQIMMNENLDAPAKQAAIDAYNANLNKSMQLVGAFSGDVDLTTMLDELLGGGQAATAPAFDAAAYLAANPDVAADPWFSQHPEDHYNVFGINEGRALG